VKIVKIKEEKRFTDVFFMLRYNAVYVAVKYLGEK